MRLSTQTSVGYNQPQQYTYYSQGIQSSATLPHTDGIGSAHRHGCDGRHPEYTSGQTLPPSTVQQVAVAAPGTHFDQSSLQGHHPTIDLMAPPPEADTFPAVATTLSLG
ncbi:hypothetical protein L7F22_003819 [Adiantum nelumboides]|nr:hypothetical protein [Adiantum nelumboides]